MKTKILLTALFAFFAWQTQASSPTSPEANSSRSVRDQIVTILENGHFLSQKSNAEEVVICFAVDTQGQVEVHRVITGNPALEAAVTKKLSKAQLNVSPTEKDQFYWITIKFRMV
jgi:outer membrane biosynthesis protein TonB